MSSTWIDGRFLLSGGSADHTESKLTMQIDVAAARLYISLPLFEAMEPGQRVHLSFLLTPAEDGGYGYALLMLTDDTDAEIDAAFPAGKPSRVHAEGNLVIHEGKKAVSIGLCNYTGELLLEDLSADTDTIGDKALLGGATLTQFEIQRGLMMGYAMQSDEGHLIMIDGGRPDNAEMIYGFVKENGSVVDAWLLTHYHDDHITALTEILNSKNDIKIKNLYLNFPTDQEHIDKYGDRDNHCIPDLWEAIEKSHMVENVHVAHKGVSFTLGNLTVKVINEAHLKGEYDYVNNSSVVYKVSTPGESVLFFGDLASYCSTLIKEDPEFLSEMRTCTIVQMAHHGQGGVRDDVYRSFERILVCLYPAARWLFDVDAGVGVYGKDRYHTLRTRELMRELNVRRSYPAKHGRVILK